MRISDGSSDVCASDLDELALVGPEAEQQREDHGIDRHGLAGAGGAGHQQVRHAREIDQRRLAADILAQHQRQLAAVLLVVFGGQQLAQRSEEHTSELQSLMRISYAVFCLKKKKKKKR